jgi:hypothetical protein
MARRKRHRDFDDALLVVQVIVVSAVLLALLIGGVQGFGQALTGLLALAVKVVGGVAVLVVLFLIGRVIYRRSAGQALAAPTVIRSGTTGSSPYVLRTASAPLAESPWTMECIESALGEIDWYQFEKFCAALLEADGFRVERTGGARPDGGVDLIVEKEGRRGLIQCKHWRTWIVKENIVREMLGSMTHFKVAQGAIYTLKGWTAPAERLASEHDITLVNGAELAASAHLQFSESRLEELLKSTVHHCPKCEAPMVERKGAFKTFWGCSNYGRTRCTGKFAYLGAR